MHASQRVLSTDRALTALQSQFRERRSRNWSRQVAHYLEGRLPVRGAAASSGASPAQINLMQRDIVTQNSTEMMQVIFSTTIATPGTSANVLNIPPRNVGLIKRFIVEIAGTYTSVGAAAATAFGLANLLSNVTYTDLSNNQRINTNGVHLAILKQVKHRNTPPGSEPIGTKLDDALVAGEFVASGTAPNFPVVIYPLPSTAAAAFRAVFEVPLAYSDQDLRGAIYGNVVNATQNLQLTLNPNPSPAGTDNTAAVWGTATGSITAVTVTVYQVYLDQLPAGNQGVILPTLDLATIYELKSTLLTGIVANAEFPIAYGNFRDFLSTLVVFNSTGATAGLKNGSDVNYWALQAANFTNIFKIDPLLSAQLTREIIESDLPLGTYYFSHRRKPLSTIQYGNMQLLLNPLSVSGTPYVNVYWEDFAQVNALTQAGSLAAS